MANDYIPDDDIELATLSREEWDQKCELLAYKEAYKRLEAGTASSQLICHFLDLASQDHELELEKLRNDNRLSKAKAEAIDSQKRSDEAYQKALEAFSIYQGRSAAEEEYDGR